MLKFVLVLPPAGAADVVNRDLSVQINGTEPEVFRLDGAAMSSQELSGTEGDVVTGSLVDIDDAGNASQPREFSFTLADTLAPPQPGELGLQVTSEI